MPYFFSRLYEITPFFFLFFFFFQPVRRSNDLEVNAFPVFPHPNFTAEDQLVYCADQSAVISDPLPLPPNRRRRGRAFSPSSDIDAFRSRQDGSTFDFLFPDAATG